MDPFETDVVVSMAQGSSGVELMPESTQTIVQLATLRIAGYGPNCFKDVTVSVRGGVLTLKGRVSSFYLKQVLQTRLKRLDGVEQIDNRVEVTGIRASTGVRPQW